MKSIQYTLAAAGLFALVACDEPYTKDPNENAAPQVTIRAEADLPEGSPLVGTRDVLMRDALGTATALTRGEGNVMNHEWDNQSLVFPSNYPFIRFNKLLDGSTIETTEKDALTNRDLGNCGPVPGAIEVQEDGDAVTALRTCYSPSDKLVGIQLLNAAGTPRQYLKYSTPYNFTVTANIKDKKGRALEPYTAAVRTRPFMLLVATDAAKLSTFYGAPGTGFASIKKAAELPYGTAVLRLVFSGPMAVKLDKNGDPTAGSVAVEQGLRTAKLISIDADGNETEVTAIDPDTNMAAPGRFTFALNPEAPTTRDTRTVFVYSPQALYGTTDEDSILPPGDYKIVLPTTVTDNGTVLGTDSAPVTVPLAAQVELPFTVGAPEE